MTRKKDEPLIYNSFEELLDILAEERRTTLRRRRRVKIGLAIYGLVFCLFMLLIVLTHDRFNGIGGMFGGISAMAASMYAATEKERKGMQALATFKDVRAVPPLTTALEYQDQNIKAAAANALPGLLPRLQASDASLLTPEHHAVFNRALNNDLNMKTPAAVRLRVAILQALQQVGDASSLPIVEEMAQGKGKAAGQPEVRQAAEDCLPYLRLRAENQRQTQTLLRASDGNMTSVDVLLRPALPQSNPAAHADELLRVPHNDRDIQPAAQPAYTLHEIPQTEQELRLH